MANLGGEKREKKFYAIVENFAYHEISKFADDTKLCRAVGDDQEADILRENLRRMFRWSQDWQMLFILEKCSVMHMGKGNQELSYVMGGKVLKVSEEERDLGVIMHRSAKPSRQCADASKRLIQL